MSFDLESVLLIAATALFMVVTVGIGRRRHARRVILLYLLQRRATWAIDLRAQVQLSTSRFNDAIDALMAEGLVKRTEHADTLECGRKIHRRYRYDLTSDGLTAALDLRLAEEAR